MLFPIITYSSVKVFGLDLKKSHWLSALHNYLEVK